VVRWWAEWNIKDVAAPQVYRKAESPADMNTRADRDMRLHAMSFEPEEAYTKATDG
jgi:hypothetical protein